MMIDYYSEITSLVKHRATPYKPLLLNYLINQVNRTKLRFSFRELACGIVTEAVDYIEKKNSQLSQFDKCYSIIEYAIEKEHGNISLYSSKSILFQYFMATNDIITNKSLKQLVLYVPYRLIASSSIKTELHYRRDRDKNHIIEQLSHGVALFYSIDNDFIDINKDYAEYIEYNRTTLQEWIKNFILESYCEKQNIC